MIPYREDNEIGIESIIIRGWKLGMQSEKRKIRETEYKRAFRRLVGGWSEVYETASGSGVGYPDLQLLVGRSLLPVEMKRGEVKGALLKSEVIRPSQISWHHEFREAGGVAFICVCSGPVAAMDVWSVPSGDRRVTSRWKEGWHLGDCLLWVKEGRLVIDVLGAFQAAKNQG